MCYEALSKFAAWAAGSVLLANSLTFAQRPAADRRARTYDPATETNISGVVADVKQGACCAMKGTHLIQKAGHETIEVFLGPSKFITSRGFSFAQGDLLNVTGSRVTTNGADHIIARKVTVDGKTLILRDELGRPKGAGMRMGWTGQ